MPRTRFYMQARDWRWKQADFATKYGACLALSIEWIVLNAAGADFFEWPGASKIATGQAALHADVDNFNLSPGLAKAGAPVISIHQLMAARKVVTRRADEDLVGPDKLVFVSKTIEAESTLRWQNKTIEDLPVDARRRPASMDNRVTELAHQPGFKYISINGFRDIEPPEDFQHGIAVFVGASNDYRLFDPNVGEFGGAVTTGFAADLTAIIRTHYKLNVFKADFMTFH